MKKAAKTPAPKFAVGDIVQLLSGGPGMTVTGVYGSNVDVTWFSIGVDGAYRGPFSDTMVDAVLQAYDASKDAEATRAYDPPDGELH